MRGIRLLGAALVGGAAIHLAFVACSGVSGARDAAVVVDAQTMPSTCSQWAVQEFAPATYTVQSRTSPTGGMIGFNTLDTFTLPAGWEPVGVNGIGYDIVLARHCVAQ